jgi:hypothetical protein
MWQNGKNYKVPEVLSLDTTRGKQNGVHFIKKAFDRFDQFGRLLALFGLNVPFV